MKFVKIGKTKNTIKNIKESVRKAGGISGTKINNEVVVVISTDREVGRMNEKMQQAMNLSIPVVAEDFFDNLPHEDIVPHINRMQLPTCTWHTDVRSA